jgi:hypothetical protein
MPRTTSNGKLIYSVDMMLAYVNIFKPLVVKIPLSDIKLDFDFNGWGDGKTKISVNDVLANKKKYSTDYARIKNADLRYPILMYKGEILDGVHRYVKAMTLKKKTINAYVFDSRLMKKFIIDTSGNYNVKIETNEYIERFNKLFKK